MHAPLVGILVLNYRQPEATLACVRRLLEVEGPEVRVLWLENGASETQDQVRTLLDGSGLPWTPLDPEAEGLPDPGVLGLVCIPGNLGYAGGNNVGARICHRAGVSWLWVLNNDTLLECGSSRELREAAEARPEVGAWGTIIRSRDGQTYSGGRLKLSNFAIDLIRTPRELESESLTFVSGCSLFFAAALGAKLGFLPEEYFLYYEDPAFTLEVRRAGLMASMVETVTVFHEESLAVGRRSDLMEFYSRRNRWFFIHKYFPKHLRRQIWLFFLYQLQKLFFRFRFDRIRLEWRAYREFRAGRMGRSH